MARPSKYKKEFDKVVLKLCELGATVPEIAEALGVVESTVHLWAVKHQSFSEALKLGRNIPDDRVERALYHRAIGYSHPDTDIRVIRKRRKQGKHYVYVSEIVKTEIIKHHPPDTRAALAWLYNRRPGNWHPLPQGEGNNADIADLLRKAILSQPD